MALTKKNALRIYNNIYRNVDIERIREVYPNIPEEDVNMCVAADMFDICENIRFDLIDVTKGLKDIKAVQESALFTLKKDFFDKYMYFFRNQEEYNKKFKENRRQFEQEQNLYENPFYLSKKVFDNQFENLEQESNLDIYAKTLFYSNKAIKELETVRQNIVEGITQNDDEVGIIKRIERKSNLLHIDQDTKYSLKDEYILEYQNYLADEISKEELEQTEAYRLMGKLLEEQKKDGLDISCEDIFKYLSLNAGIRDLYLLKDTCIENIISLYSKQESKNELAVYHCLDKNAKNSLSKIVNNNVLSILVRGTNTPIKVHCSKALLQDLEQTYSVEIPSGEKKIDYKNTIYVKYNDRQKKQIENLNSVGIKSLLDYKVRDYVEEQYDMCNDVGKIKVSNEIYKDR